MAVVEPVGAAWQELRAELEEAWIHATPLDRVWTASLLEGQPVVRVLLGDRWREIRLKRGAWSGGRRAAYEKLATGAAHGELFFSGLNDDRQLAKIMCRMVAWLPRERMGNTPQDALPVRAVQPDPSVLDLKKMNIKNLRDAIRANRVSFPSQVPMFAEQCRPDLQVRLAQLYFGLGWNSRDIGQRYELTPARVQKILNAWKRRAVKALYIQNIPRADVLSQQTTLGASPHPLMTVPNFVHQFTQPSF